MDSIFFLCRVIEVDANPLDRKNDNARNPLDRNDRFDS